jgi:hypothetical protein
MVEGFSNMDAQRGQARGGINTHFPPSADLRTHLRRALPILIGAPRTSFAFAAWEGSAATHGRAGSINPYKIVYSLRRGATP